jgi:hypothetical protein
MPSNCSQKPGADLAASMFTTTVSALGCISVTIGLRQQEDSSTPDLNSERINVLNCIGYSNIKGL